MNMVLTFDFVIYLRSSLRCALYWSFSTLNTSSV